MIGQVRGRLIRKEPTQVVVDVGGVGYELFIPLSTFYQLPEANAEILLHTHTHVREDTIHLYGFRTREEKALFDLLRGVAGIGPRLATNILSGISVEELVPAIAEGDLNRLKAIPGVGRKTAERLIVELKEKVGEMQPRTAPAPAVAARAPVLEDVISALINLGCNRKEAARAADLAWGGTLRDGHPASVASGQTLGPGVGSAPDFEKLIKVALKHLPGGR